MSLASYSPFISAIGSGIQQGQDAATLRANNAELLKQQQLRTQEAQDDRAALAALGAAFGVAPPNAPLPVAPGQASVPTTSAGNPVQPPGGYMTSAPVPAAMGPPPAPPGPNAAAVAALQPPPPGIAPPPSGGAPPPAPNAPPAAAQPPAPPQGAPPGPPPAPPVAAQRPPVATSGAPQAGMSAEQLAQRILAANPQLKNRPDLLVRAMTKGQALLAPDAKAELAALTLQQKIDAAQQKFEMGQLSLQNKLDLINQANAMKLEIAKITDATRRDALTQRLEELEKKLKADAEKTDKTLGSKERIAAAALAVKQELGDTKNLNDATKIANTQWYQKRVTELKEQGLADAAIKAQMDDETKKIVAEIGATSRENVARTAAESRQLVTKLQTESRERISQDTNDVRQELGSVKNLNDTKRIEGTQWYQKRITELKAQQLTDAEAKSVLDAQTKEIVAKINATSRENVAGTGADARRDAAQIAAAGRSDAQGVTQQFRAYAQQTAAINRQITEMLAGGKQLSDLKKDEKTRYDGLVAQRDALAQKAKDIGDKAAKAGVKMPKFADEVKEAGAAKPAAAAWTPPQGLPAVPPGAVDGTTAKDGSGQVVAIVKDGQWAQP